MLSKTCTYRVYPVFMFFNDQSHIVITLSESLYYSTTKQLELLVEAKTVREYEIELNVKSYNINLIKRWDIIVD